MPEELPQALHIAVPRTARYYALGNTDAPVRSLWIVLHGYAQAAAYFIRKFESLQQNGRLIIAPEALSRFYIKGTSGHVGASWMTREDREYDIQDNVAYLDSLYNHLMAEHGHTLDQLVILGFSQGGSAAARWVALGKVQPQHLIMWGSDVPPDLYEEGFIKNMQNGRLWYVHGDADEYITPERASQNLERIAQFPLVWTAVPYAGAHNVYREVLQSIAEQMDV